jgi:hypothetical protein
MPFATLVADRKQWAQQSIMDLAGEDRGMDLPAD